MINGLQILSLSAVLSSLIFYISPFFDIIYVLKSKDVSKLPVVLYIITILNCTTILTWALKQNIWEFQLTNIVGVIATLFFLSVCAYYKSKKLVEIIVKLVSIYTSTVLLFWLLYYGIKDSIVLATLGSIFTISLSFSTLGNVYDAFKNKDRSFIPLNNIVSLLVNSSLWFYLSIIKKWSFIVNFPNMCGIVLTTIQLFCYVIIPVKSKENSSKKSDKCEEAEKLVKSEITVIRPRKEFLEDKVDYLTVSISQDKREKQDNICEKTRCESTDRAEI